MLSEKARFLRILGDETKLKIIQYLLNGEQCACKLVPYTKRAQSTVSTHLTDLERTGILESRREGRNIYYKIRDKKVYGLCKLLGIKRLKAIKNTC
jgi:ArsR family transcriptional regulator